MMPSPIRLAGWYIGGAPLAYLIPNPENAPTSGASRAELRARAAGIRTAHEGGPPLGPPSLSKQQVAGWRVILWTPRRQSGRSPLVLLNLPVRPRRPDRH
jgi:hypothetical protein